MNRTVWLASYPKSGNTWFRLFLAQLLHPEQSLDFNKLRIPTPIASSRTYFDDLLGLPSALLTAEEIARLRPEADRLLRHAWQEELLLRKTHDIYDYLRNGKPMLGQRPSYAALYILRNPWDVAVSMTNHFCYTLEQAVDQLLNPDFTLAKSCRGLSNQLAQPIGTWERHVTSWITAPLDLHVLRYESMKANPLKTFLGAVRFLGLDKDEQAVQTALDACRFERLQTLEHSSRFRETPSLAPSFFRSGRVGDGLTALAPKSLAHLQDVKRRVDAAISRRGVTE